MKRKLLKAGSLISAALMLFGFVTTALAADEQTNLVVEPGTYTASYTVEFDAVAQSYASAQFDIVIDNKNELDITDIAFDTGILNKAGGTVNTVTSGGEVTGNKVLYQAGFFSSASNQYQNQKTICTVTLNYIGTAPVTVSFENLKLLRFTGAVENNVPVMTEVRNDWSRTVHVSRTTGDSPPGGGEDGGGEDGGVMPGTSATVTGTRDGGTATAHASVDTATMKTLVDNAKTAEQNGQNPIVEIVVESDADAEGVDVTIPNASFKALSNNTNAPLRISTDVTVITYDAQAVEAINTAASGDIVMNVSLIDPLTLDTAVRQMVGDRPVYDFSIFSNGSDISTFGRGSATVGIRYTLKSGEDPNAIIVYYIDEAGRLETVRAAYNSETGMLSFTTTHFSAYAVGYNKIIFTDAPKSEWYGEAVTFLAARGITTGTGPGVFSPAQAITRGQFIVMLMRAYNIEPDAEPADNFNDAGDTYYTNYLAAAKRLGLTNGIGGNLYAPDMHITRQDMFTLLYRMLGMLGELPSPSLDAGLSDFSDAGLVNAYALDAIDTFIKSNIVHGSGGKILPNDNATRAEMAKLLFNLLSA